MQSELSYGEKMVISSDVGNSWDYLEMNKKIGFLISGDSENFRVYERAGELIFSGSEKTTQV